MSKQFYFKQFSIAYKNSTISNNSVQHKYTISVSKTSFKQFSLVLVRSLVLFYPSSIGPYQAQPLTARVNLAVMAMKAYSALLQTLALLEPHHLVALCHIFRTLVGRVLTEKQPVYSTVPADWAGVLVFRLSFLKIIPFHIFTIDSYISKIL